MSLILDGTTGVPVTTVTGTLPVANGGTGVATSTGSGANALATSPTLTTPVLSGSVTGTYTLAGTPTMGASLITSGTAVATTSGTSIDFTSIPSWVKRITVVSNGVSVSGTSSLLIQIGPSSAVETTGYISTGNITGAGTNYLSSTAGFVLFGDDANDADCGIAIIVNISGNIWVYSQAGKVTTNKCIYGGGNKTLASTLARLRLTTFNGTDTFDAGSVNILYE